MKNREKFRDAIVKNAKTTEKRVNVCELCGELLNHTGGGWKYDGRKRPDNCPLMEVEDE